MSRLWGRNVAGGSLEAVILGIKVKYGVNGISPPLPNRISTCSSDFKEGILLYSEIHAVK